MSAENPENIHLAIDKTRSGLRLDHLLVQSIPSASRSLLVASIRSGCLLVDGEQKKSSYRLKEGERISGTLLVQPPLDVLPEDINFPILYEDQAVLVLSKPPGLVVHPGSGNYSGTLVNGLVHHCASISGVGDDIRPGIVHRLDKDTSGIMVVAKNGPAHRELVDSFKSRKVHKEYIALTHGTFTEKTGRLVASIGRHSSNRKKMAVQEGTGRYAVSNWSVIEEFGQRFSLLRIRIETGRTHQIRVHMAHLRHPVAGDTVYGSNRNNRDFPRQMLHAYSLSFNHPVTGELLSFKAPLWDDFTTVLEGLSEKMFRFAG